LATSLHDYPRTIHDKETAMPSSFVENYREKHKHPLNKLTHAVGIPTIEPRDAPRTPSER
jgi:hypothetical protein